MKSCVLIREYSDQTIMLKMEKSHVCLRRIIPISQILVYIILFLKYLVNLRVNYNALYTQIMLKKVFTPPPPVSYSSARNISSNLVQVKLYPRERWLIVVVMRLPQNVLYTKSVKKLILFSSTVTGNFLQDQSQLNLQ